MARRRQTAQRTYQVFRSHSSQDRWICEVIREKIEAAGLRVWLDAFDLPGGANVKERIKEGVMASDECLILLSPASRESDWVRHEGGVAHALGKWTAILLLHAIEADVPEPFRNLKFLNLNDFPSYLEQLVARAGESR